MNDVMLTIVGNVIAEPEAGTTRDGVPFATFRVASTSRRFDTGTGGWANADTLYLHVRCWRGVARNITGTLRKGSPVVVQGRLKIRTVVTDGPDGERRRSYTDLDAVAVGLDLARLPSAAGGAAGELVEFGAARQVAA